MSRHSSIRKASKALVGVSITTLQRWEIDGKLVPERTAGNQRSYDLAKIKLELFYLDAGERKTIAYARVSSKHQIDNLDRQKQVLEFYCAKQGWTFEIITDLSSGMNFSKKSLKWQY